MSFVEFLTAHWTSIVVVALFIAAVVFLMVKGKKEIVYKMLYVLVTEAEERYGSGAGAAKFAEVMTRIYTMLPAVIKIFISYETLGRWIEEALTEAKEHWAKGSSGQAEQPKIGAEPSEDKTTE